MPDVFLNYFKGQSWDWIYIAGYPISEPYWAKVQVGGASHDVLIQVFERRTVTFDPSAPEGYKVQFGNVGTALLRLAVWDEVRRDDRRRTTALFTAEAQRAQRFAVFPG